jgi:hypothetical protein
MSGYTLDDLIKAGQAQAEAEEEKKEQGEKTDEEVESEEKKKEKREAETSTSEETKTSALKDLADSLRASAVWIDKVAGPVPFSEPTTGGGVGEGGAVTIEPQVTGEQTSTQNFTAEGSEDPTKVPTLGTAGAVPNTETDPLTTQTQAEPAQSTAMQTGKTTSGPAKSQPLAADGAKVAEFGAYLRGLTQVKMAAEPTDEAATPAGDRPDAPGVVGSVEPPASEQVPIVQGGDAAASKMTPQAAEQATSVPDMKPLLNATPKVHAEGGEGTPNVDAKLGSWQQRVLGIIEGGA